MNISTASIMSLVVGALFAGCNIAGPANPEKNGRAYLEERGYSGDLISRLVDGQRLEASEVGDLQASKSADVRFLVAKNRSLTHEQIDVSIASKDDFTRSGAANNTNLSSSQIARLTDDESPTVYSALAGNTALSDQQLMWIRDKRGVDDVNFAMNPNCPEPIRQSIVESGDSLARHWLKVIDEWKAEGRYKQDSAGRWFEPLPSK